MSAVREIVRSGHPARVPGSRPPLRGLRSVRGEVVLALELGEEGGTPPPWLLVLRGEGDLAGVLLDGVEEIREYPPPEAAGAGSGPGGGAVPLVQGIAQDERGAVAVLDPARLRTAAENAASAGMGDGASEDRNGV